jgi:predicted metal-binding membrane protein
MEAILKRDRAAVLAALIGITALAWLVVKKFIPFPRRLGEGRRPSGQVILSTLTH